MTRATEATTTNNKRKSRANELEHEAQSIKDSRGCSTVQVTLRLGDAIGVGDVPAGASKGADEALTVSTEAALKQINTVIIPMIKASNVDLRRHDDLVDLERQLVGMAGDNYAELAANAVLPISRALWQLAAKLRGISLAKYLRTYEPELAGTDRVRFYMNIFNGGLHALRKGEQLGVDRIDIQEIMVVPITPTNYRDALVMGERIDAVLKDILIQKYSADRVSRGDEAGFSVQGLGDSATAIAHVIEAIERAGYLPGQDVQIALDVAASSFYDKDKSVYQFRGAQQTTDQMIEFLNDIVLKYHNRILSIEDGLDENDWEGWSKFSSMMREHGVVTIGDDLFVSQMKRLRRGVNNKSAHAILVKVNQNGSITGTLEVMRYARQHGIKCIISHRSGETLDDSIADLALATGSFGLKTGDPQPEIDFPDRKSWVRRRKYLRMVNLEEYNLA